MSFCEANLDSLYIYDSIGPVDLVTVALFSESIDTHPVGGLLVGGITHSSKLREVLARQIVVTEHQGYSPLEARDLAEEGVGA